MFLDRTGLGESLKSLTAPFLPVILHWFYKKRDGGEDQRATSNHGITEVQEMKLGDKA